MKTQLIFFAALYPTTILIDQNGKVVRAGSGLHSVVPEILKLLPPEEKE